MKDKLIATKDEDALLAELERLAGYFLSTKQNKDIIVTQKQAKMLRRVAVAGDGFVDRMGLVGHLRDNGEQYRVFKIVPMEEARRHTKKDLLKFAGV